MSEELAALKRRYPGAETFKFGDSAALCDTLLALVRAGKKVATCGALRDFEAGEPMPAIGRRDIALNWDDTPALVIETVELVECRFDEVTEAMALAEGEDDSLEGWRAGHRGYFERNGGFSPDLPILWERFVLIEDLAR
ncbi:ASCH domain-containing protein [Afifella sp. YEN Y35]|uniref:ASCH domain-containing protein n=1 Tax=Afifella sp. YEN Y35 TaxID=3388337 RepID=UPI0039E04873